MESELPGVIRWLLDQAIGVIAAAILFYLYVKREKQHKEELIKQEEKHQAAIKTVMDKYEGVVRDRRDDSNRLNDLMSRVNNHLTRADAFEDFARRVIQESMNRELPKRRAVDSFLSEGILKVTED